MRLGGPVFRDCPDPDSWIAALKEKGYRAAYCPVGSDADDATVSAYEEAARKADVVIAEVGAWSNPLSSDEATRREALEKNRKALELADRIGACCCVNISGSRGERWDGPHPLNLTRDTFDLIVQTVRSIIDAVAPTRTFYTLETMPCMYPDSARSYAELLNAIDRRQFGVHFDAVNLICSPQRYFSNGELIREFVAELGQHIKSCHAKDIILADNAITHLSETRVGTGALDYATLLKELDGLGPDVPLMLEHLSGEEQYDLAAEHVRSVAAKVGVTL